VAAKLISKGDHDTKPPVAALDIDREEWRWIGESGAYLASVEGTRLPGVSEEVKPPKGATSRKVCFGRRVCRQ